MTTREIVAKLWNLCNVLMDDGITYHQYVTELIYILFLKMAKETGAESQIPETYRWDNLTSKSGIELKKFYKKLLTHLGEECTGRVREIYQGSSTNIDEPKNLEKIITKEVWIYDLRNDMPSFGKTNPLKSEHFDDFVKCYADGDLSKRKETYSEENPNGRWRKFTIEDILARDKTSLDITWLKADSGTADYTLVELLDMIKEKSNNIAKAVAELEALIGEVEE